MDVVDGLRNDSLDELLANLEFGRIKEYVEKRSREEAQALTVTPMDTVQHCCSPCPLDPEPSSVYVKLENTEGKMGPELEELESPSAGTGLETPGQQCPPNEGTWDQRPTTTSGILTAGVGPCQRINISSPTTESVEKRAKDTKCSGIDLPATIPSPVLSTVSPSSSSSSEGFSTTVRLVNPRHQLVLRILLQSGCELFLLLQPCPSLNSVDGGLVSGLVRDDLEVH